MAVNGTVIIGAGHAGVELADHLRRNGYDRPISLIDQDDRLPYQRPPLSKQMLVQSDTTPVVTPLRGESFYAHNAIDLIRGIPVSAVDRRNRSVDMRDGRTLPYEHLVFATGARSRDFRIPGSDLDGVVTLRTLADALDVGERMSSARSAVIIGAGFIGLEFAAAARARGISVTIVENADRPMKRGLSPEMSAWFADDLAQRGVRVLYGHCVAAIAGSGTCVESVTVTDAATGTVENLSADIVLVGVGVLPRSEIAERSGLLVDDGIVVDEELSTADPSISAIGDCANFPSLHADSHIRLECVQNAVDQARYLAARLTGTGDIAARYRSTPWFWTHQGTVRLAIVGLARSAMTTVVHGDRRDSFSLFGFDGDELVCVESLNAQAHHMAARRILTSGMSPTISEVTGDAFNLKEFSRQAAVVID